MGLDLWFREDVARILASTHEAMRASTVATSPTGSVVTDAYQQGFVDALRAVAVAFGVCLHGTSRQHRHSPPTLADGIVDAEVVELRIQALDLPG